ncbi:MAG: protein kinase [Leptolyngbyaceae cyanobacterium CRU_2_3]|nr:protein kinase [Leptolyngbyaceae cyanobacterium CRU_2_3]
MSRSISLISPDKPLGGRYKLTSQLGVGGFGRTFLAEDLHLPGHPQCVIKQLKPQIHSDDALQMARRCFNTEAQVLYQLGIHDQIPRLLAHFEDNQEFYLAQEYVEGEPLTKEFVESKTWSENQVVFWLKDLLQVLAFVHHRQVIHRDLKPSNLIRRRSDRRIVLIDFGAVKQVSTQGVDPEQGLTNITISIGTQGYMPNEQIAGKPRFSSDIYAVGILGIQALTGIHPRHLGEDLDGEISWHHYVPDLNPELAKVLDHMVRYDFRERYPTAVETLAALEQVPMPITDPFILFPPSANTNGRTVEPGTTAPFKDSSNPISEFSSADFTMAEEDFMSTAIWNHPEAEGETPSREMPNGISSGLPNGMPGTTNGITGVGTESTQNGTGITQVVSPLTPSLTAEKNLSAKPILGVIPLSWLHLGSILATAAVLGLSLVWVREVVPGFNNTDPNSTPLDPWVPSNKDPRVSPTPTDPKKRAALLLDQANQLRRKGEYEAGLKVYDQALSLRSDYAEAYAGRCETLNLLKRSEEAIVSCNDALAFKPDYPEALWSKGNALLLQNRTYEALKIYEDVTFAKPDFAEGWVKRGVALQMLERSAEALTALDEGIRIQRQLLSSLADARGGSHQSPAL